MYGLVADDRFPVGALVPLLLLGVAFVAFCLVDLARSEVRYLPKWVWALICVASVPVGGLIYLLVGRQPR
jgi:Phospholipase_D-nuclease N-terminal